MSKKKVKRIGVVGFGFMGRMHYGNWKKIKGAQVVALCDKDLSQFTSSMQGGNVKGADTSTDFGTTKLYDDYDRMLAEMDLDIVSITLPTPLHLPLTAKALKAGVHVICEKPMALDTASCDAMLKAAKEATNGAKLMIAHCLRFWPAYTFLKKIVESKKYGAVRSADFHRFSPPPGWSKGSNWLLDESKSGGVALDLHIHDSDMIHYLFGMPKSVSSSANYAESGTMLHINTVYNYNGPIITATGNWSITPSMGFDAGYLIIFEHAVIRWNCTTGKPPQVCPEKGAAFDAKLEEGDGYLHELQWFLDFVNGKKVPLIITPEQSRNSVRLVDAEKKSAHTRKTIKL